MWRLTCNVGLSLFEVYFVLRKCLEYLNICFTGWPRNRENREFGSYFFQTGKTRGILLQHRENF